eukprot:1747449-Alexandrium_andersonii.AAC.1
MAAGRSFPCRSPAPGCLSGGYRPPPLTPKLAPPARVASMGEAGSACGQQPLALHEDASLQARERRGA